ncbi:MAG: AAA family ATPase [Thermodesulfobacteriota bacterium]
MPRKARLVVFFGLVATGKTCLAQAFARRIGARHHNSDEVRKELAGLAPTARAQEELGAGIYSPELSRRTYRELLVRAEADLAAGQPVVLDAAYKTRAERQTVRELGQRLGVPARFVFCTCPEAEVQRRLALRAQDPEAVSDGRWEIHLAQRRSFEEPAAEEDDVLVLDTAHPLPELLARLDAAG